MYGRFYGNTIDNLKNESCSAVEMRNMIVFPVTDPRSEKKDRAEEVVNDRVVEKEKNEKLKEEEMRKKKKLGEDTHLAN